MIKLQAPRNTTGWRLGGTNTFRKSSGILLDTWGMNLQNPSKRICRLHIADEGKILLQADQAGAEALIVAYLCPDGNYRQLFLNGIKPHIYMALHLFRSYWEREMEEDLSLYLTAAIKELKQLQRWKELSDKIKNHERYYFIGKKSIHSFSYRKMPGTFIFDVLKESEGKVVLDKKEGERIHEVWKSLFPEIHIIWWNETDTVLRNTRTLRNLFGYPRYFGGPFTDKFFREATSFIPQSTVGCITSKAFVWLQNYIERERLKNWDLLNDKHDSILMQVPEAEWEVAAKLLKGSLEQDLVGRDGVKFKMKAEVSMGKNWGKHDEEKNPEGMKELSI